MLARSESRDGYKVRVLAVHTSEGDDRPSVDDAAALRDASWWTGSSHAIADDDPGSLLTPAQGCVPYDRASWTLRSGNRWSENIELIGWAHWIRAEWLARPRLLDRCAYWLAVRSEARGIPLVKLSPAEYRAGRSGVIGHVDHTVGYSDGTHWDPGPGFPWDVVLAKANDYRDGSLTPTLDLGDPDMRLYIDNKGSIWKATDFTITWVGSPESAELLGRGAAPTIAVTEGELGKIRAEIQGNCAALMVSVTKAAGGDVDEQAIIAGLLPQLTEALAGKGGLTRDDVEAAVRQVFGDAATGPTT